MTSVPGTLNRVSAAFENIRRAGVAEGYLERYYGLGGQDAFTGSYFDGAFSTPDHEITADDFIAVSCLSVHVPARAAVALLGERHDEISAMLARIPTDMRLEGLELEQHDVYFGEGGAVLALWRILRSKDRPWGIGPTTASKVIARKRPLLVPIYDSAVAKVTGFDDDRGTWRAWHEAFRGDPGLVSELTSLRKRTGLEKLSLLRVLDVVLWMHSTRGTSPAETVGEESA